MTGMKLGDKYLVESAYKEEWIFMLIPIVMFVLMLITQKVGRHIHLVWLGMWFITQFLCHEWYTLFESGFMGDTDKKIAYFSNCIQLINVDGRYVPDVYHTILHILIIVAFIMTLFYKKSKNSFTEEALNSNFEEDIMSLSLGVHRGKPFDIHNSEFIDDRPVSFYRVWIEVWSKAISECRILKFVDCHDFTVNEIPNVLVELDAIYNWVQYNGGKDRKYITWRIEDLKEYLSTFYLEHKGEDYWFDLG